MAEAAKTYRGFKRFAAKIVARAERRDRTFSYAGYIPVDQHKHEQANARRARQIAARSNSGNA